MILEKGKARLFLEGNPIVYGGAIASVVGDPEVGEEVIVKDNHGNVFARGFFNPHSQYRVRIMSRIGDPEFKSSAAELIQARISQAVRLRSALGLPSAATNVYRLINGEGDRLGGLIIDVLGSTVVIQSSALWVEMNAEAIKAAVSDCLDVENTGMKVLWRRSDSRLEQDGYAKKNVTNVFHDVFQKNAPSVTPKETVTNTNIFPLFPGSKSGTKMVEIPAHVPGGQGEEEEEEEEESGEAEAVEDTREVVVENGVKYWSDPVSGQKTGFYCDQRENRQIIRQVSGGKTVLDTYCYTGGFTLNAIQGGAVHVTSVDSSGVALAALQGNLRLNKVAPGLVEAVQGDAVEVMKALIREKRLFDVVICDPPKLAPKRTDVNRASNKYQKINELAMALVKPGGLLLTCTCSAAMSQPQPPYDKGERGRGRGTMPPPGVAPFTQMLNKAAGASKKHLTVLASSGAAGDHPVLLSYPEGKYLTALLTSVC